MTGHVRKRRTWEVVLEFGAQAALRCPACRKRYWLDDGHLEACPKCDGPLEEVTVRRQECQPGYRVKKDAQAALTTALGAFQDGKYVAPDKLTVAQFLRDEWLPSIEHTVRPTTYLSYRGHVLHHILPHLGAVRLQKLTPAAINAFYAELGKEPPAPSEDTKRGRGYRRPKALSASSRHHVHVTLHRALRDAVKWRRVAYNAAADADPPKVSRRATALMNTWTQEQLRAFLEGVRGDRLYPLWRTLAMTGTRRGEAVGLRWQDVDLDNGRLSIRQARVQVGYEVKVSETKTGRSRVVALDPGTVDALAAWKDVQALERSTWPGYVDSGLVFTREDGTPLHPGSVSKFFDSHQKRLAAELAERHEASGAEGDPPKWQRLRLHDLRHTHATLALAAGIHPKVVSERLGHANVSMTLDVYSHAIPALQESAATLIAALVDVA